MAQRTQKQQSSAATRGGAVVAPVVEPLVAPSVEPVVEPQAEPEAAGPDPISTEEAIEQLLSEIDDQTGHQACVYELVNGEKIQLMRCGLSDFSIWDFGQTYGGGSYELRIRAIKDKKYVRQSRFKVSDRVPRKQTAAALPAPTAPADSGGANALMQTILTSLLAQQGQMLAAIAGRPQGAGGGLSIADAIALADRLSTKAAPAGNLLDMVKTAKELREVFGDNGAEDEFGWLKHLAPAFMKIMDTPNRTNTPNLAQQQRPVNQLPMAAAAAPAGVVADRAPAATPTAQGTADAAAPAPGGALKLTPTDSAARTLGALVSIVMGWAFAGGKGHIGEIVVETMSDDALGELLDVTPAGQLPAAMAAEMPEGVRDRATQEPFASMLAQLETFLRAEITDEDDDQVEKPAIPGEADVPKQAT